MQDHDMEWFSEEQATFGDRVAGAREAAGLSQEDLAQQLGVKLTTLRDWEEDASEPRANKLQMMSGVLNVSMPWLLTGVGDGVDGPGSGAGQVISLDDINALRSDLVQALRRLDRMEQKLKDQNA